MISIRPESPEDASAVRRLNELAFGQSAEAELVDRLRAACGDALSLVAVADAVVGHILFTPVIVESASTRIVGMGLAPMAVLPDRQRQGIGAQLVRRGVDILRERGCPFVVVVGHPEVPSALRVRARVRARPGQPMGRDAGRGVHGLDSRRARHGGRVRSGRYRDEFDEVA